MDQCEIIRDLMPLYVDGLTGEESNIFINHHIYTCAECRELLEHMRTPMNESEHVHDEDSKRLLITHKRKLRRKTTMNITIAALVGVLVCLLFLTGKGVFSMLDRQTSPSDRIAATVYRGTSGTLYLDRNAFTVRIKGDFPNETVYSNASFDGMWWSPDSRYLIVSMQRDNGVQLVMSDFQTSVDKNLNAYLDISISNHGYFADAKKDENGFPDTEYRFLQWSEFDSVMLIHYYFIDISGIDRSGYFWFDCDTNELTGVMELPVEIAIGKVDAEGIRSDGSVFYMMDLHEPDENGNTVEFVFYIVGSAHIRGTDHIQPGDDVMVVYRPSKTVYNYPAISVTLINEDG